MEDSDSFTPNYNGCNSILCKYKVTSDGDDAVSYNKALQSLQSTLRKDKYDGNGVAAQNDPLYKNLARCIGFFDKNKEKFPRQQDCVSKNSRPRQARPQQARPQPNPRQTRPQPERRHHNNTTRKPAPMKELKEVVNIIDKLKKYSNDHHLSNIYYMIQSMEGVIRQLKMYKVETRISGNFRVLSQLMDSLKERDRNLVDLTDEYSKHLKTLENEMDEYIIYVITENTKANEEAKEEAKEKAKEEAKRRAEEAKRRAEEARRALSEEEKEEARRRAEQARRMAEKVRRALSEERRAEEARRALSEERKAEETRRALSEERRFDETMRALSEERRAEEAMWEQNEKWAREQAKKATDEAKQRKSSSKENKKTKKKSRKSPPRARASPPRNSSKKKRCPNGTRRNKKTGNCEPYNK